MMQRHILQLTARLEQAESKLEVLESCKCFDGFTVEGLGSKTHGQTWEADCQSCHCQVNVLGSPHEQIFILDPPINICDFGSTTLTETALYITPYGC